MDEHFPRYDLLVIGSGPAGEGGAAQAAYFGKKVALIEKETVPGGAATNTGTLPSKTLRETALFLSGFRHRALEGLDLRWGRKHVTVRDFMTREQVVVDHERARIHNDLKRHNVAYLQGQAAFEDAHTLRIRPGGAPEFLVQGDVILIATGSYPRRPPGFSFTDPRIYDSDEVLDLDRIPASLLVVGGGVIGCEYASMFAALGIRVVLVERRDRLIGFMDQEVSETLRADMTEQGVEVLFGDEVLELDNAPDPMRVRFKSGKAMEFEAVLVSAGRCASVQGLGLDRLGLKLGEKDLVPVNDQYQTAIPHIYAAGDVIGFPALASTSREQARIAMVHAFDIQEQLNLTHILPYGIYTVPECSMAGATEDELRSKGTPYVVGKALYEHNARGLIIGDRSGFLKLLFHAEDLKLLGVHVIGEQATDLVHVGLSALMIGAGADLFLHTCYNHPTLSELYKDATFDALNRLRAAKEGWCGPVSTLT